ncbi:MAG: CRISPR-associated protein Csn1, partial [Chlorobi bacterium]|nr:CRISPR-associated protein Csn1 [Chlorobiota bacterium]
MKKILGLDLGTNSIGWALVEHDFEQKEGKIIDAGSRIIPMSQDILGKFDSGQSISQTAERTNYRGVRRLYQRENLRRERLHRVLNILNFLPQHYKNAIDFDKKLGQFKYEVKINYKKIENRKYEFLFKDAFNEMIKNFKEKHPELFYIKKNGEETKIPYDWTIYYLRKKALTKKIEKEELAWIILNFNQKRGYYQLRGEEEEVDENKEKTFEILKVKEVVETDAVIKKSGDKLYDVIFENGWKYDKPIAKPENWLGKTKEFIVTTSVTKSGEIKRTFKNVDSEKDWIAIKKKTEQDLETYLQEGENRSVGTFIYDTLLKTPNQKIRGRLIKTIERKFYKEELIKILKKQIEFHNELNINTAKGKELYILALNELYKHNEAHKNNIRQRGFNHLFVEDIIFYQRPLKSQKSNIGGCQYEYRVFKKEIKNSVTGETHSEIIKQPVRAISKSHPLFQEFRLWQFIHNLRIYQKEKTIEGRTRIDVDVTSELFKSENDFVKLFDFLRSKKEIKQSQLINFLSKEKFIDKEQKDNFRWNYVEDKTYPVCETRAQIISRLEKTDNFNIIDITDETILKLWHIIYSVKDKIQYKKALEHFADKNSFNKDSFVKAFEKFPPFKSDYAAYSEKAIKKLLPLMRLGKYWNETEISPEIKQRINDIIERLNNINYDRNKIETVSDDDIPKQILKSFIPFKDKNSFSGLNTYQAAYAVYGRHSEVADILKWESPDDIDSYLQKFKQHSLRNPIVEQVVTETLRTVRDIWKEYGKFDEIHIELGRELKNPAEKRKSMTQRNIENENTNYRIKQILKELMNEGVEQVKDYSPSHQEILKIYEEGIYQNPDAEFKNISLDEIEKIRKNPKPSKNDIIRYKLWLKQGYVSPYTGEIIPLNRLFTSDYQIEHIIPQSRYFDNSLSNKVICESEVNLLKGNQTAYEFIKDKGGSKVDLGQGKSVLLFTMEKYEKHCRRYFIKNKIKLKKLLAEDIPESFIERQINDTRYISKFVKSLLSNIVRAENEQSETSKNLIPVSGAITSQLKQDWGLNDKWNEIILPRFERLNKLTGTNNFTYLNEKGHLVPTVPDELQKGFNKKRIDHRHHALDAIVIACTTRQHIQYLNSLNNEKEKYELQPKLLIKNKEGHYTKNFQFPWSSFPIDVKKSLDNIIISFKQNLRVINKATNYYQKWVIDENGNYKKKTVKQEGVNWAIRKPLHKEMVYGKVHFDVPKNKVATAIRTDLTEIKSRKHLDKITDKGIIKILENHLKNYTDENGKEDFEGAFSPNGIEEMNKNIIQLNNGRKHQPIYKVRLFEIGSKFPLSENENSPKSKKYVEAAKGTNLYFAVYETADKKGNKKRNFVTIPLNEVIEHQKQVANLPKEERTPVPVDQSKGKLLFTLSPNDLVYVPTDEELENIDLIDFTDLSVVQKKRVYKMVSTTGGECHFVPNRNANEIVKNENGTNSKEQRMQQFFDDSI